MSNFKDIVSASEVLKARFEQAATYVISAVQNEHGVEISRGDVAEMVSVKNSVLANDDTYQTDWKGDVEGHALVKQAAERKRLKEALERAGEDAEAQLAVDQLSKLTPEQKIAFARSNGLAGDGKIAPIQSKDGDADSKAELIRQCELLRGGMKIAFARKHGLL